MRAASYDERVVCLECGLGGEEAGRSGGRGRAIRLGLLGGHHALVIIGEHHHLTEGLPLLEERDHSAGVVLQPTSKPLGRGDVLVPPQLPGEGVHIAAEGGQPIGGQNGLLVGELLLGEERVPELLHGGLLLLGGLAHGYHRLGISVEVVFLGLDPVSLLVGPDPLPAAGLMVVIVLPLRAAAPILTVLIILVKEVDDLPLPLLLLGGGGSLELY